MLLCVGLCNTASVLIYMSTTVYLQICSGLLNITAHLGQNITLPCRASSPKSFIAVEWTRSDLMSSEYVFFCRGRLIDKTYQHSSFANRVDLLDRQMKEGNLSVILRNVSSNDTGTYECRVKEKEGRRRIRGVIHSQPISVVRLTVTNSGDTTGNTGDRHVGLAVGLLVAALFFVVGIVFVVSRKCKGRTEETSYHRPAN